MCSLTTDKVTIMKDGLFKHSVEEARYEGTYPVEIRSIEAEYSIGFMAAMILVKSILV